MVGCAVALGALVWLRNLDAHPRASVALFAAAFGCFGIAVRGLEHRLSIASFLAVAGLLRLVVLPLPPSLSDDVLRYVWDGRVTLAGYNPYLFAPEDPELAELRDANWQIMPHKEVPTVYPPLALALFAAGGQGASPLLGIRILLAFIDWFGCGLTFLLAARLGGHPGRAAWYAWNPLVVLEVAGQGHVDGAMVASMVACVLWIERGRFVSSGLAAAAGVATKLVPLVALVPWALTVGRKHSWAGAARFTAGTALGLLLTMGLVVWSTGMPPGLVTYGVSWEFNGPIYEPLWRTIDQADVVDPIKGGITRLKDTFAERTGHEPWNRLYPYVYPQLLAKLLLAAAFLAYWLHCLTRCLSATEMSGRVLGAVILCSATVYPWYLLWVLPWAALTRHRAWLTLSGLMFLAYLPQHADDISLFPWVWGLIWIPFALLLWRSPSWSLES